VANKVLPTFGGLAVSEVLESSPAVVAKLQALHQHYETRSEFVSMFKLQ